MSLSAYLPERHEVVLKGGSFFVTGLSLNDFATLLKNHLSEMDRVFDLIGGGMDLQSGNMEAVASTLLSEAPGLVANIIAVAAGEPGSSTQAARLPFPVQLQTLVEIGRMTFEETGGVKKSLAILMELMGRIGMEAKNPTLESPTVE